MSSFVESLWFEEIAAGGKATGIRSMQVDPATSLRTLRAGYKAACRASDQIMEAIADLDFQVTRNGKTMSLRRVLLVVIGETSRHAGHADIIREQIDGKTGR